jgi:hypothetical protein
MAPERISPPNPNKPDYDIRADVWSLGITLVELATGQFPYKDCQTEFEVLTKVIQDDPPCLPQNKGFSIEFRQFVHDCLLKNPKDRPKYKKLLEHPFIIKYRDMEVDVGHWYFRVANHSGDPNKVGEGLGVAGLPPSRKTSLEQRHEVAQQPTFKPQPSPRMVKSWRMQTATTSANAAEDFHRPAASTADSSSSGFSRLNFYTPSSPTTSANSGSAAHHHHADETPSSYAFTRGSTAADTHHHSGHHQYHHLSSRLTDHPDSSSAYSSSHHQLTEQQRDQKRSLRPGAEPPSSPRDHQSKYGDLSRDHQQQQHHSYESSNTSPRDQHGSRSAAAYSSRNAADNSSASGGGGLSPRYEKPNRLQELSPSGGTLRYYESTGRTVGGGGTGAGYLDSSRLHMNGTSLNRSAGSSSSYVSSYHGSASYHRAAPPSSSSSYSRSHLEDYPSSLSSSTAALKSPPAAAGAASKQYEKYGSYLETSSARDYGSHHHHPHAPSGSQRKYSFESSEAGGSAQTTGGRPDYSSYTPKGTRRYEAVTSPDSPRRPTVESRKAEMTGQEPWQDSSYRSFYLDREAGSSYRTGRDSGGSAARKYPSSFPVPSSEGGSSGTVSTTTSRGRDPLRDAPGSASGGGGGRSNFLSSLKLSTWALSSPLSMRRFRTSSSTDRAAAFERHQPAYRSLNEKDKQLYSTSGKSDKL